MVALGRRPGSAVVEVVVVVVVVVGAVLDYVAAPVELATAHSLVPGCISFSS